MNTKVLLKIAPVKRMKLRNTAGKKITILSPEILNNKSHARRLNTFASVKLYGLFKLISRIT